MSISHAWSLSSDAELITAVRSGESVAFGVLYERHEGAARSVARQYSNSSADAEDAVADAFSRVFAAIQGGGGPDVAFRAYLFTVIRRVALRRVDSGRRAIPTDDLESLESMVEQVESTEAPAMAGFERGVVSQAYRSLPERWQAVLWYTEIEELSPAEIAPVLGLTANGVAALAYRAREGLRQAYLQQHLAAPTSEACTLVNSKLGAYVRGGLARRETALVESHIDECGNCRALVLELGDVNHGMRVVIGPLVLGVAALAALKGLGFGGAAGAVGAAAGAAASTAASAGAGAGSSVGAGAGVGAGVGAGSGAAAVAGAGVGTGALVGAAATAAGLTVIGAGAANLVGAQTASASTASAGTAPAGTTAASVAGGGGAAGSVGATAGATAGLVGAGAGATAAAGGGLAAVLGGVPLLVGLAAVGVVVAGALGVAGVMGAFSGPDVEGEGSTVAAPADGEGTGAGTGSSGTGDGTDGESDAGPDAGPDAANPPLIDPTDPTNIPDDVPLPVTPPVVVPVPDLGAEVPGRAPTVPPVTVPPVTVPPVTVPPVTVPPVVPPTVPPTVPTDPPAVPPKANLLTVTIGEILAGDNDAVDLTLTNGSDDPAVGVVVEVVLPAGLAPGVSAGLGGRFGPFALLSGLPETCTYASGTLTCTVAQIPAHGAERIVVPLTAAVAGEHNIAVAVHAPGIVSAHYAVMTTVWRGPELAISVPDQATTLANPGEAQVAVEITNGGDRATREALSVALTLPAGVTARAGDADARWGCAPAAEQLICTTDELLPALQSVTLPLSLLALGDGSAGATDLAIHATTRGASDGAVLGLAVEEPWAIDLGVSAVCVGERSATASVVSAMLTSASTVVTTIETAAQELTLGALASTEMVIAEGVVTQAGSVQVSMSRTVAGEVVRGEIDQAYDVHDCTTRAPMVGELELGSPYYDSLRHHSYRTGTLTLDNTGSNVPVTFAITGSLTRSVMVAAGASEPIDLGAIPWSGASYQVSPDSDPAAIRMVASFTAAPSCAAPWTWWQDHDRLDVVSYEGWNWRATTSISGLLPPGVFGLWDPISRCGQG